MPLSNMFLCLLIAGLLFWPLSAISILFGPLAAIASLAALEIAIRIGGGARPRLPGVRSG